MKRASRRETRRKVTPRKVTPRKVTPRKVTPRRETRRKVTRRKVTPRRETRRKVTPRRETRRRETRRKVTPRRETRRKVTPKNNVKSKIKNEFMIPENKKYIENMIYTTKLKKGLIIYRTQPVSCKTLKPMKCEDTGKRGIYFGTNQYTPIGMILEYNKPMYLCKYKLKEDVELFNGKYIFRYLDPSHHFKTMDDLKNGKIILNKNPRISTNHIDGGVKGGEDYLLPIHHEFEYFESGEGEEMWKKLKESELFITDPKVVECIDEKYMTVEEARNEIRSLVKKLKS